MQRNRRQFLTRPQWIADNVEELRQEHLLRIGQGLERTAARLRWSFKRVADWERDQTVSCVDNLYGDAFDRNMSVAAKFASEWSPILGCVHRTASLPDLRMKINAFATIPAERRLSVSANHALMADFSEGDVLHAIMALSRHKSAGPDGLNNDFYKDTSALFDTSSSGGEQ